MNNINLILLLFVSATAFAGEQICKNNPIKGYDKICVNAEGQADKTHYMYTLNEFTATVMGTDHTPVSPDTSKKALCKALLGEEYSYVKGSADVGYKAIHEIACITNL